MTLHVVQRSITLVLAAVCSLGAFSSAVSPFSSAASVHDGSLSRAADALAARDMRLLGQIGGAGSRAIATDGRYAFLGNGPRLVVVDVATPALPRRVGDVFLGAPPTDIAAADGFLFATIGPLGLAAIDVHDPARPAVIGVLDTPGEASAVAVDGGTAYVADGRRGLRVVDVADPYRPREIGAFDSEGEAVDVAVDSGFVFLAHDDSYLNVIDAADRARPRPVSRLQVTGGMRAVTVTNGYLLAVGQDTLVSVDVRSPQAPRVAGRVDLDGSQATAIDVADGLAYVFGNGLTVVDVRDPTLPTIRYAPVDSLSFGAGVVSRGNVLAASEVGGLAIIEAQGARQPTVLGSMDLHSSVFGVVMAGDLAYVVTGNGDGGCRRTGGCLRVVDVRDPAALREIATLDLPDDDPREIVLAGSMAYVVMEAQGLVIVDIATPAQPRIVGAFDTPGQAIDVAVAGSIAYALDRDALHLVDVGAPAAPQALGSLTGLGGALDVAVAGGTAYVAARDEGVVAVDVRDPARPVRRGTYQHTVTVQGRTQSFQPGGLVVAGEVLHVLMQRYELGDEFAEFTIKVATVEVTNPAAMKAVGVTDGVTALSSGRVVPAGPSLYVNYETWSGDHLLALDVATPRSPRVIGRFHVPGAPWAWERGRLMASAYDPDADYDALALVDAQNLRSPRTVSTLDTAFGAAAVAAEGGIAYVLDDSRGLRVIDARSPRSPVVAAALSAQDAGQPAAVATAGGHAYLVGGAGLRIVDARDPRNPRVVGTLAEVEGTDIAVSDRMAYVVGGSRGLRVVDVANPAQPREVGSLGDLRGDTVAVAGTTVVVGQYPSLMIVDVATPSQPTLRGSIEMSEGIAGVAVQGTMAYVAAGSRGLRVVDVSQPDRPVEVGAIASLSGATAIGVEGTRAYVLRSTCPASYRSCPVLHAVDIGVPSQPVDSGSIELTGQGMAVAAAGAAFVAAGEGGLFIAQPTGGVADPPTPTVTPRPMPTAAPTRPIHVVSKAHLPFVAQSALLSVGPAPVLEPLGQLGGPVGAVAVAGDKAYIGLGDTLAVLDVAAPAAPRRLGQSASLGGTVGGIALRGGTAWVAAGHRLWSFDVTDSAQPRATGRAELWGNADALALHGDTAYVAAGEAGLWTFDIRQPQPVLLGILDTSKRAMGVAVAGTVALVSDGRGGLRVVDVADPARPVEVASMLESADGDVWVNGVAVAGTTAFVATDADLVTVDIADPRSPRLAGRAQGSAEEVVIHGDMAYVAGGYEDGVRVVDVRDPANPVNRGTFAFDGDSTWHLDVSGTTLLATFEEHGLRVVDAADPAALRELGAFDPPTSAGAMALIGNTAYLAHGSDGLQIVDVANPSTPRSLAVFDTPGMTSDVAIAYKFALLAEWRGYDDDFQEQNDLSGLRVIDVERPAAPREVAFLKTPDDLNAVAVHASIAYAAGDDALYVIDVANPASPRLLATYDHGSRSARDLTVTTDQRLYLVTSGGLQILDVSRPDRVVALGEYELDDGDGVSVSLKGSTAWIGYTADQGYSGGLLVVDVSDPARPVPRTDIDTGVAVYAARFVGQHALLATRGGLLVLDISQPARPVVVDRHIMFRGASDLDLGVRDALFVAGAPVPLLTLRYNRP